MTEAALCYFLCNRPLGRRIEWHHPVPKAKGGKERVRVHPICHRTIHCQFSNAELAKGGGDTQSLQAHPEIAKFLDWIAGKPPDFHSATRRPKR